jgi:hypothetical protein
VDRGRRHCRSGRAGVSAAIAEVALVFRGDKGAGKGVFVDALRRIFGEHGVYIADQELLTGRFKGHLRSCLFLFVDEAFWSGDKKGVGVLQALITQSVMHIEQKGVDALPWANRLHIVMVTDREWAVPAGAGEQRYAVFEPSNRYARTGTASEQEREQYFKALFHEMENGGLAAMMYDLLGWDLGGWHPRQVYETAALQKQKKHSLSPIEQWFAELLDDGRLPGDCIDKNCASTGALVTNATSRVPRLRNVLSESDLGTFLKERGCLRSNHIKTRVGELRGWKFPQLKVLREDWAHRYGGWDWTEPRDDWTPLKKAG